MYQRTTIVKNETGIHARPASQVVKCAKQFQSSVFIGRADDTRLVDAKSIVMLLTLALSQETHIKIQAEGADEQLAVDTLISLIDGFTE